MKKNKTDKIKSFLKEQVGIDRNNLYLSIGLGSLSGILIIAQAWIIATMLSDVIFEEAGLLELKDRLLALLVIFFFRTILTFFSNISAHKAASNIKLNLRDRLLRHIQTVGPVYPNKKHSGSDVNALIDGVEAIEKYYTLYIPGVAFVAILPLAYLVIAFPVDWISALILLVTAPVIVFFMILIGQGAEKLNQKQWRQLSRLSSHFIDAIQGLPTLKIFNAAKREALLIKSLAKEYKNRTMSVLKVAFLSSLLLEFFTSVGIAMIAVTVGFRLLYGQMEFVDGMFILLLAPEFYLSIRNMGSSYHARMEGIGAAEQIVGVFKRESFNGTKTKIEPKESFRLCKNDKIEIEFKDVCFSYKENQEVLKGINLKIPANKNTVLIGESGSGKSTIANLLLGFVKPDRGEIIINSQNLDKVDIESWRESVAWLPQSAHLFQGTIAENIKLAKEDASKDEMLKAAKLANCDEFIQKLPHGYDTHIGERGAGLSGGQMQRVALSRAFLKDAPLLILDEASASLDKKSEESIENSIEMLSKDRTIITIAHRLHTIKKADQIVIVDKGEILGVGTHKELIEKSKFYQKLIKRYYEAF